MENGNANAPAEGMSTGMMVLLVLVGLLVVCCCSSVLLAYNRTGNINIFSSSSSSESDAAFLKGFSFAPGAATEDDSGGLGLLDMFGVKQNCKVGEWGSWSPCSSKCGSQATHTRSRPKTVPEKNGGSCLMPLTETQTCTGLPACEVPPLTGQYEPCEYGSTLTAGSCIADGQPISDSDCEHIKQQAVLYSVSFGTAGAAASSSTNAQAAQGASTGALAVSGLGVGLGPAAVLGMGIGAAVAAGEIDCDAMYLCPTGFRDTRVNKKCDKDAIPKCPPDYEWNNDRKLCTFKNP